jgi:hypothetical protein
LLQLQLLEDNVVRPPQISGWVFLVVYYCVCGIVGEKYPVRMGYRGDEAPATTKRRVVADVRNICSHASCPTDVAPKIKKSGDFLIKLMVGLAHEMKGRGLDTRIAALAHEVVFLAFASAGLQTLTTIASYGPEVVDPCVEFVLGQVRDSWDEYIGMLRSVEDGQGPCVYGGGNLISPLHLVANALYFEKGVTGAEFENCLGLPSGFVTEFAFPEVGQAGWLESIVSWFKR